MLTLLSWLLKSGVPRGGGFRGGEVLPQGRGGAGGTVFTTTGATGSKGEVAVGALLTLLAWLLKSGVPRGGEVRGGEVLPQGRGGAGGEGF